MKIQIHYQGRFGNRLFQYGAALVNAIENGYSIENPLDTKIFKKLDYNPNSKPVGIHKQIGFFQGDEDIKKLIKYKSQIVNEQKEERNETIIHCRLGDLLNLDWTKKENCEELTLEYIEKCLSNLDKIEGYITSDSCNHKIIKHLLNKYNLELYQKNPEETLLFASNFKNKILTTGTFSWFIGFLGSQHNVMYPVPKSTFKYNCPKFKPKHWNMIKI